MTKVTISDAAQAMLALENERKDLWKQASDISAKQMQLTVEYTREMVRLSGEHAVILEQMVKLDEFSDELRQTISTL